MDEIRKIPPVTRSVVGLCLGVTLPVLLHLVSIYPFVFVPKLVTRKGQLWRLFTCFGFGGKGLPLIFDLFLMYRGLNDLEESHFQRRTAEMAWSFMLICGGLLTFNLPLRTPILFRPLLYAVTHLWAQTNPTNQVSLFGMINLRAPLFPFAMLLLDLVQAGPGAVLVGATGIVAAHAYFFAKILYPRQSGGVESSLLAPPQFLVNLLGNGPDAPGAAGSTYRSGGGWGFRPTGSGGQRLGSAPGSSGGIRAGAGTPSAPAGRSGTAGAGAGAGAGGSSSTTTATAASAGTTGHRWGRGHRLGEE